jgi:chromosomal replication initiator protein
MIDNKQLWDSCLADIQQEVPKASFITWFKNTRIAKQDGSTAYIGVPNEFFKDWLSNKYDKLILKTLMSYSNNIRAIEYVIMKNMPKKDLERSNKIRLETTPQSLPLNNLYPNRQDNLNPRYRFDSFVVGSFNELAHAAAQAVTRTPGGAYNPYFVYGPTGLGKTHLIQAIGNEIVEKHPNKQVHYISLEKFAIDYVNSLKNNKPNEFKQKYRKYDVLIMDDIQFISNKEKTQEELFHLFNTLYEANKQIVFSSDKHPHYIPGLEDRLRTRFGSGMIVDISTPDTESKIAILQAKCKEQGVFIDNEIIEYMATSMKGSIRELEGSLNTLICQIQLKNKPITLNEAKNLIKNNLKPKRNISISEVVKLISDYYNVDEASIYEKTRRKEIVRARQMIMYILREEFSISYPLIGQKLGGKDHTTVIHSCVKIKNELEKDDKLNQDLEHIKVLFG